MYSIQTYEGQNGYWYATLHVVDGRYWITDRFATAQDACLEAHSMYAEISNSWKPKPKPVIVKPLPQTKQSVEPSPMMQLVWLMLCFVFLTPALLFVFGAPILPPFANLLCLLVVYLLVNYAEGWRVHFSRSGPQL